MLLPPTESPKNFEDILSSILAFEKSLSKLANERSMLDIRCGFSSDMLYLYLKEHFSEVIDELGEIDSWYSFSDDIEPSYRNFLLINSLSEKVGIDRNQVFTTLSFIKLKMQNNKNLDEIIETLPETFKVIVKKMIAEIGKEPLLALIQSLKPYREHVMVKVKFKFLEEAIYIDVNAQQFGGQESVKVYRSPDELKSSRIFFISDYAAMQSADPEKLKASYNSLEVVS